MRDRPFLTAYGVVAIADAALAGGEHRAPRVITKPLLMPLLALDVVRRRAVDQATQRLVLAGLGLSWVGDVALLGAGEGPFAVGLGSFLAAHCCYLLAFARRRGTALRRGPAVSAASGLVWLVLNALLLPRTGKLRIPVLVYGTVLTAMAAAALRTGERTVAVGGGAFLLSDAVLALGAFDLADDPRAGTVVMLSYTCAQALIATGMTGDGADAQRRGSPRAA